MKVLITNDDGIHAPGIRALLSAVPRSMEVVVAAPASERSASSHSISLGQKLRVEEFITDDNIRNYAVHGTPADSVKFAIAAIPGFFPDVVLSGINQGVNTGISVYYSGTISAAREGFINRIPAVAVSLCSRAFQDFSASIEISRRILDGYASGQLPRNVMLNVNVPPREWDCIRGVKITKQANSRFIEENELPPLLNAADKDGAIILNVFLKPSLVEEYPEVLQYQGINSPTNTIIQMDEANKELIWMELVKQVKRILIE